MRKLLLSIDGETRALDQEDVGLCDQLEGESALRIDLENGLATIPTGTR